MPCRQSLQHLTVHRDVGCICNTRRPPSLTLPSLFSRTESIRGNPANCSLIQSLRSAETHTANPMWQIHTAPCETKETDRKVEMFEVGYPLYSLQFSLPPSLTSCITRFVGCLYHQFPIFISPEECRLRGEGKTFTLKVV